MELKELFEAYREARVSPKFSPGEIIIARSNVGIGNAGIPCIVLEVREGAEISFAGGPGDYGSNQFGKRNDIRIACWMEGDYCPFWDESWKYIRYVAPFAVMEDGSDD